MPSLYALRAGSSYVGFTFARKCQFVIASPNVTHARQLQYTMHPTRPNIRMEPSPTQIEMTDPVREILGEAVRGNRYFMDPSCCIRVGKKEAGTTMRRYQKEPMEALKYTLMLERVDAEHFAALPFALPSVGIVVLRDILEETGREICFGGQAVYPHRDNESPQGGLEALLDFEAVDPYDLGSIGRRIV